MRNEKLLEIVSLLLEDVSLESVLELIVFRRYRFIFHDDNSQIFDKFTIHVSLLIVADCNFHCMSLIKILNVFVVYILSMETRSHCLSCG
jgi:hypothetical protein